MLHPQHARANIAPYPTALPERIWVTHTQKTYLDAIGLQLNPTAANADDKTPDAAAQPLDVHIGTSCIDFAPTARQARNGNSPMVLLRSIVGGLPLTVGLGSLPETLTSILGI
jgi:hypothetical protein